MGERSARERDAAYGSPRLELPHLGDDAPPAQVGHQQIEAAELDRSIAITRDCFEPGSACLPLGWAVGCCEDFDAGTGVVDDAAGRFFADFDIEILRSVHGGLVPHHRSPTTATRPAGQDLGASLPARNWPQYRSNRGRMPVLSG